MDMPPYLAALRRLILPFQDEPTLQALRAELDCVEKALAPVSMPASSAQATVVPLPQSYVLTTQLRQALGSYVIYAPGASTSWVRCITPGCQDGWRGSA